MGVGKVLTSLYLKIPIKQVKMEGVHDKNENVTTVVTIANLRFVPTDGVHAKVPSDSNDSSEDETGASVKNVNEPAMKKANTKRAMMKWDMINQDY